jgi:selenide, water dikinase
MWLVNLSPSIKNEFVENPKLTSLSHGSGCGCKIAPADLENILKSSGSQGYFENLLIGHEHKDDAAVWDLGDGKVLISTTDFFMPIVDDPFDFGEIAAVNAISDVYAMGGTPVMAVAILGWPVEKLGAEMAAEVIKGGRKACSACNIPLAGGHSIDSPEPFFGLAVSGIGLKSNIKSNKGAQVGDGLFLTKPLGTGIVATAQKRGLAAPEHVEIVTQLMKAPNTVGAEFGKRTDVHAMTDITGFGLLGHLIEICQSSEVSAEIQFDLVPTLGDDVLGTYLQQFIMPDNTMRNFKAYGEMCSTLSARQLQILCDPQTSGGLLVSSSAALDEDGSCVRIGRIIPAEQKIVLVQ